MNAAADLPVWAAVLVALFVLTGAFLTLVGCFGLTRLHSFYFRIHAPTLGTSFGTLMILLGSVLYFSLTQKRPAVHEALIFIFVTVTTPVTLMLLARAALYRDRAENNGTVPPPPDEDVVGRPR
ncbi:MAG TPA: monovalent cation/H(+) antiporter subunit G [Opitutus sp.]|nr:monovalent cation/H(+) antiporter subunit G [Opitutus sp.]